jgi:probable F420-dependent oxidoreductase
MAVRFAAAVAATSDFATLVAACRAAEAGGFDAFARPDHLIAEGAMAPPGAPLLECFTTIAALVPLTTRIRFVQTVACNSFRNPALLAKMVASLDVVSGGRIELGLGAGWLRAEYEAYGYPFPPMATRLAQLREALQVVKRLWAGGPVHHDGVHYRLRGAVCAPRPVQRPRPPILVGGGGTGLLAIAAAEADIANVVPPASHGAASPDAVGRFTLEAFRRKTARLRALAAGCGRPPGVPIVSAMTFVRLTDTPAEAETELAAIAARYGLSPDAAAGCPLFLVGTPAALRTTLAGRIRELDLGYVVLHFPTADVLARFAAEVLPGVRAGVPG